MAINCLSPTTGFTQNISGILFPIQLIHIKIVAKKYLMLLNRCLVPFYTLSRWKRYSRCSQKHKNCLNDKTQNLKRHSFKQKEVEFKFHVEIEVINNHILSTATASHQRKTCQVILKPSTFFFSVLYEMNTNTNVIHFIIVLSSLNQSTFRSYFVS